MDNNSRDKNLLDKYNISDGDEESASWRLMLDLDAIKQSATKVDWYSTKTFEAFLDALDIDQPSTTLNANNNNNDKIKQTNSQSKTTTKDISSGSQAEGEATTKQEQKSKTPQRKNFGQETILSAEALKILSELPDLSHMSSTRSFMFPNGNKSSHR